mgnify:CR=1 FL=1
MSIDRSEADLQHPGTADPQRDDALKPAVEDVIEHTLRGPFRFYDAASAAKFGRNSLPVVEPLTALYMVVERISGSAPQWINSIGGFFATEADATRATAFELCGRSDRHYQIIRIPLSTDRDETRRQEAFAELAERVRVLEATATARASDRIYEDGGTVPVVSSDRAYFPARMAFVGGDSLPAAQSRRCDACEGAPKPYAHLGGPGGSHFCRRHAREALAKTNPPTRFTNRRRSAMKAVAVVVAVLATAVTAIGLRLL